MAEARDTLGKVQAVANIAAAVIVPLLVAYIGWQVQLKATDSNNSSEFVGMALKILADESKKAPPELRAWAIAVVDSKSPVPLSKNLSSEILAGNIPLRSYLPAPNELMEPPAPLPEFTGKTNGDLVEYILEVQYAYQLNSINHKALLEWIQRNEESKK